MIRRELLVPSVLEDSPTDYAPADDNHQVFQDSCLLRVAEFGVEIN